MFYAKLNLFVDVYHKSFWDVKNFKIVVIFYFREKIIDYCFYYLID